MNPQISSNYFQERAGVLRVEALLNAARLIFRETPNADVGIDGYIELVDDSGQATGATVATQIKSGNSYLIGDGNFWNYYPSKKHQLYWEMYPLPVILIIHDPISDNVYWSDVRLQLRSDQQEKSPLLVSKDSLLTSESRSLLFATAGTASRGILSPIEALVKMAKTRNPNIFFSLSFLDIFLEGLTDIGRKLFFSAGLCCNLASVMLSEDTVSGVVMEQREHTFLDSYLRFLVAESLAYIDYSDVLIDQIDRQMHPTMLVPLTSRGRKVRDLARAIGGSGNRFELTEAFVELADSRQRSLANIAVAHKINELSTKNTDEV